MDPPSTPRRLSAWENQTLKHATTGNTENLGKDHADYHELHTFEQKAHTRINSATLKTRTKKEKSKARAQKKAQELMARKKHTDPLYVLKKEIESILQEEDIQKLYTTGPATGGGSSPSSDPFPDPQDPQFQQGLDTYFDALDQRNRQHKQCAHRLMVLFGIVTTLVIVSLLLFVNNGYQDTNNIVGFVTTKVEGIGLARSPLMAPKDALVFDGLDVVVPPKEKNALFLTTRSYQIGRQEHGTCVGLDVCTCPTSDKMCDKDCPSHAIGRSGVYTGRCIRLSSEGSVPEDRRCEVTTWCPVLDVQYAEQTKTVNPAMKVNGIANFIIRMTINGRFPKFQQSTQYNVTASVQHMIRATLYDVEVGANAQLTALELARVDQEYVNLCQTGAVLFVQFVYDCDIDRVHAEHCQPTMVVTQVDSDNAEEKSGDGSTGSSGRGYGFKTVDYFAAAAGAATAAGGGGGQSRRVRHLKGLRFIFDVTGRARQFSFVVMMVTVISGFGFAALAFIAVNEGRLLCEERRVTETEEELRNKNMDNRKKEMAMHGGEIDDDAEQKVGLLEKENNKRSRKES